MCFYSNMNGDAIGELNVYSTTGANAPTLELSLNNQSSTTNSGQSRWEKHTLAIDVGFTRFQVQFEGVRGGDYQGDIAIDDITFDCKRCASGFVKNGSKCDPCPRDFYKEDHDTECQKCPSGSKSDPGARFCNCEPGYHFSQAYCKECPRDTYSSGNTTNCPSCPPGSTSSPGSSHCSCSGGLYMENITSCRVCPDDTYSYSGSWNCTACPDNTTSLPYQAFCSCPPGTSWDFKLESCQHCRTDHYNLYSNMTSCIPCPNNSISNPGAVTCSCHAGYKLVNNSTCEICPENTISSSGSLTCSPCPHFKAAAPGSEFCYKCTLGEYWENHKCLPCPDHLYGDGVHCRLCPDGFSVLAGFCYKECPPAPKPITAPKDSAAHTFFNTLTLIMAFGLVVDLALRNKGRFKDVKEFSEKIRLNYSIGKLQSSLKVKFSRNAGHSDEATEKNEADGSVDLIVPLQDSDLEIGGAAI